MSLWGICGFHVDWESTNWDRFAETAASIWIWASIFRGWERGLQLESSWSLADEVWQQAVQVENQFHRRWNMKPPKLAKISKKSSPDPPKSSPGASKIEPGAIQDAIF